jgi:hypothetical protein
MCAQNQKNMRMSLYEVINKFFANFTLKTIHLSSVDSTIQLT